MNYERLSKLVIQWGKDKQILEKSTPLRQLDKTQEELEKEKQQLLNVQQQVSLYQIVLLQILIK